MTDENFQAIAALLTSAKDFKAKLDGLLTFEAIELSTALHEQTDLNLADLRNMVDALTSLIKPE